MKGLNLFSAEDIVSESTVASANLSAEQKKAFVENNIVMVGETPFVSMTLDEAKMIIENNPKNRLIDKKHVKELMSQVDKFQNNMPPMTLNITTFHIIDGNHRFDSYKENGKNVRINFMVVEIPEEDEINAIIAANLHSKGWTLDNLVTAYNDGENDYNKLIELAKKMTVLCLSKGKLKYRIASSIITGRACQGVLKEGKFKATTKQFEEAITIQNELVEFLKIMGFKSDEMCGAWTEPMAIVWHEYRNNNNFTFDEWMTACKDSKKKFTNILASTNKTKKNWDAIFTIIKCQAYDNKTIKQKTYLF